jgi:ADP-ribose pyrophosphatase YjhB (NUDIX family)
MQSRWLDWMKRLAAIAQTGLTYTDGPYDRERYEQICEIVTEMGCEQTGTDREKLADLFAGEIGYATPKVDLRAAIFQEERILLVRERAIGQWTLPGGWADVGEPPSLGIEREVREETGYDCRAVRLLALYDRDHARHGHAPYPFHVYKLFFLCELTGGTPAENLEIDGIDYFAPDAAADRDGTSHHQPNSSIV